MRPKNYGFIEFYTAAGRTSTRAKAPEKPLTANLAAGAASGLMTYYELGRVDCRADGCEPDEWI
jgi:hypothetical protein